MLIKCSSFQCLFGLTSTLATTSALDESGGDRPSFVSAVTLIVLLCRLYTQRDTQMHTYNLGTAKRMGTWYMSFLFRIICGSSWVFIRLLVGVGFVQRVTRWSRIYESWSFPIWNRSLLSLYFLSHQCCCWFRLYWSHRRHWPQHSRLIESPIGNRWKKDHCQSWSRSQKHQTLLLE